MYPDGACGSGLLQSQFVEAGFRFLVAAHVLAQVIGELDTLFPRLVDIHLAAGELHHDVGRLVARVVGEVGADAERAAYLAAAVVLYLECLVKVEGVAEDDGLGRRVDSQFAVAGNEAVGEEEFVTGIAADAVEELGLLAADVAQEDV